MAVELFNKIKTFNLPVIAAEIAAITPALPVYTIEWSGFENERYERVSPFAEATRDIARETDGTVDTAARGDVRFDTRNPLSAARVTSINTVLDDHDGTSASDTTEEARDRQQDADVQALRVLYDAGIADTTLDLTVKLVLIQNGEDL